MRQWLARTAQLDWLGLLAVTVAAIANTLLKAGLAIALGSKGLRQRITLVLGSTAVTGAVWAFTAG